MSKHLFKIQPRWFFYGLAFILVVARVAFAQPEEFIDLDNKITTGGCALWGTFLNVVKLGLAFGAGYAVLSYFIGSANTAVKVFVYVLAAGAVFVVLIAGIKYFFGGDLPCTTTAPLGPIQFANQQLSNFFAFLA